MRKKHFVHTFSASAAKMPVCTLLLCLTFLVFSCFGNVCAAGTAYAADTAGITVSQDTTSQDTASQDTVSEYGGGAQKFYVNEETGFSVLIDDKAGLLSEEEKTSLAEEITMITDYGNACFASTADNPYKTSQYAEQLYYNYFNNNSGTLLLIDMDNREVFICSNGAVSDIVKDSDSEVITDNIYSYLSKGEYFEGVSKAFRQILSLLEGHWIAAPMKYIGNALLALLLALLVMFVTVTKKASQQKVKTDDLLSAIVIAFTASAPVITKTGTKKSLIIRSSGNGSSGGGIHGGGIHGGGFSGGGFSGHSSSGGGFSGGSGGGHRF